MEAIEASIEANIRPTTMILGSDNRKRWSKMDVLVMRAYKRYKNELCDQCGNPRWICRNPDPRLDLVIKEAPACYTMLEVKRHEEKHKDEERDVQARPEYRARDDVPLHKYRQRYYDALAAERAEDEG